MCTLWLYYENKYFGKLVHVANNEYLGQKEASKIADKPLNVIRIRS